MLEAATPTIILVLSVLELITGYLKVELVNLIEFALKFLESKKWLSRLRARLRKMDQYYGRVLSIGITLELMFCIMVNFLTIYSADTKEVRIFLYSVFPLI